MEVYFVLVLVLLMAGALAMGYPVAFALPGAAILSIAIASLAGYLIAGDTSTFFSQGGPDQWLSAGVTNFRGIYWEIERDTLIAIPLFIFMGIMLQRSKIAEDLLITMAQLFGPIPGGLGISVVFVAALLAATTGIVGATVIAMGLISLPAMLRSNYSPALATGTIAASGTLGQIIPPSIVLIILADQLASATDQASTARKFEFREANGPGPMPSEFDITSTSAGDMFLGAFLPGLVLVGLYAGFILILALIRPKSAPAIPYEGKYNWAFALRVFLALVPPLTLILVVLGSIIMGIATVNQAGAIGAVGATIMAGYRLTDGQRGAFRPAILAVGSIVAILVLIEFFDLNVKNVTAQADSVGIVLAVLAVIGLVTAVLWSGWRAYRIDDTLRGVMIETAKTTSMVFIILLGAAMLTAAFRSFGGEELAKGFLGGLPGGFWTQFIFVMAVIFALGFFLDFIEIAVVVVPIVAPILLADPSANITAVWLGVMIGVNMQTSFLTPPFGFALFYLRGVAPPQVRTTDIYRGVVAFIGLQLLGLAVVGFFPPLANYLPAYSSLTSETAPPPKNPRLQACMEENLFTYYDQEGDTLRAAIQSIASRDMSVLPEARRKDLTESFTLASASFDRVADVRAAAVALDAYVAGYKPLHREVRGIQADIRDHRDEIKKLQRQLSQSGRTDDTDADRREMANEIALLEREIGEMELRIPDRWTEARKGYVVLADAEDDARRAYQRTVDAAYAPVQEVLIEIRQAEDLTTLSDRIGALDGIARSESAEAAAASILEVYNALARIAGTGDIRTALSDARRILRKQDGDVAAARVELAKATDLFADEVAWREAATRNLAGPLSDYDLLIRNSIGVRQLDRLPSDLAGSMASCLATHKDISLHF
ncbi:MAG: TRAP transporter large permease subunit [Proteobacteria bacterium]|nr:TRAP transporter large permease subunit [Pseudomonadota bacterium]